MAGGENAVKEDENEEGKAGKEEKIGWRERERGNSSLKAKGRLK